MGWRGILRDMGNAAKRDARAQAAASRRADREALRQYKAFVAQQAAMNAWAQAERERFEVDYFKSYLAVIVSLHQTAAPEWDWNRLAEAPEPEATDEAEGDALFEIRAYKPTLSEKLLGKDVARRRQLAEALEVAKAADAKVHAARVAEWTWYAQLARGILAKDVAAFASALAHLSPFDELEDLGVTVSTRVESEKLVSAGIRVRDEAAVVPVEELRLGARGKLAKPMPKAKYWGIYQDHVCSAMLRVGREVFALLPVEQCQVTTYATVLNRASGREELQPIVDVTFTRSRFSQVNFARIDPSEALSAFPHAMAFTKNTGFAPIARPGTEQC